MKSKPHFYSNKILTTLYVSCAMLLQSCAHSTNAISEKEWISIFDGESLVGWVPKISGHALGEDPRKTFKADGGVLRVNYERYETFDGAFAHLFFTKKLSDYRLRLEYRLVGEQVPDAPEWASFNSGVMLHSQDPASIGYNQAFPVSVEAQFLAVTTNTTQRTTGNVCTPGTDVHIDGVLTKLHCVSSSVAALAPGEWVKFEADVKADEYIHLYVNGETSLIITKPQFDQRSEDARAVAPDGGLISSGYIALQAESHPVEFRNIQVIDRSAHN